MWFFLSPKTRRTPFARSQRGTFRPRLEALEDRCLLSAGALDPTFGTGGKVIGGSIQGAEAVVVQADGKIVAGASVIDANGNTDFALVRYMADGSLDNTFGTNGFVSTKVGSTAYLNGKLYAIMNGLVLQSDGKIVAVGSANVNTSSSKVISESSEVAVARYMPNGQLDSSFGSGGIVLTKVVTAITTNLGRDQARAVTIQVDGKIDVAGVTAQQTQSGNPHHPTYTNSTDFALVRYNANGSLDTSFGGTGIVVTPNFHNQADSATSQADWAAALAIQPDGKILQTGYTNSSVNNEATGMALVRYTSAGVLDSSFGPNHSGIVAGLIPSGFTSAEAWGVLVQSNGFIVAAGYANTNTSFNLMLTHLNSAGILDPTFGDTGQLGTTNGSKGFSINSSMRIGLAIAQGGNGDFLAAATGKVYGHNDYGVVAFLPSGAPDPTFGTGGTTTTAFSSDSDDRAFAMAIQGDGKIVATGYSAPVGGSTSYVALARFLPPNTKIGSLTANPNPVVASSSLTLTVSGILNSNPSSTISNVVFYQDANNDSILEIGTDTLLGTGTQSSPGVWTFTFSKTTSGTYTLFALAQDSNGVVSDPVAVTIEVI
jgi:uncharacterized delta-60 repeat protein